MRKILIGTPNGFLPRYDMFPEHVMGHKLHQESGIKVTFLSCLTRGTTPVSRYRGVTTLRLPLLFGISWWRVPIAFMIHMILFLIVRPDILWINHFRSDASLLIFTAKIMGIKTVLSEAGILHDEYLTDDRDDPLNEQLKLDNIIYKSADLLKKMSASAWKNWSRHWAWYNSDRILFFSKHNLKIASHCGLPEERVRTIRHWVDLDRAHASSSKFTPSYEKMLSGKTVIFLICQLKLRKGYDIFLSAAKEILELRDDVVFIMASSSEGDSLTELERKIEEFDLKDGFLLRKKISNSERNWLYKRADAYLMPSRYEGFGLPAIEAGISGAVVIAGDVPALNGFLKDGYNALLFNKGDVIDCVASLRRFFEMNDMEARSLKKRMYETCEYYDINRLSDFTTEFLEIIR